MTAWRACGSDGLACRGCDGPGVVTVQRAGSDGPGGGLSRYGGCTCLRLHLPAAATGQGAGSLAPVRLTAFWDRMRAQFGETYAESVAKDHVLTTLGGRTVNQALADGEDAKTVWRAVCETFNVPERLR